MEHYYQFLCYSDGSGRSKGYRISLLTEKEAERRNNNGYVYIRADCDHDKLFRALTPRILRSDILTMIENDLVR